MAKDKKDLVSPTNDVPHAIKLQLTAPTWEDSEDDDPIEVSIDSDHPSFPHAYDDPPFPRRKRSERVVIVTKMDSQDDDNNNNNHQDVAASKKMPRKKVLWIISFCGIPIVAALLVWVVLAKVSASSSQHTTTAGVAQHDAAPSPTIPTTPTTNVPRKPPKGK